jgi:Coenzyme PQQ synthesis protein D (PqqD)
MAGATNLTLMSQVKRNRNLLSAETDEELVMMSIEAGAYYGLDQVGRRIWEMIAEPLAVGQICERLIGEYDVTPELCQQQVMAFLGDLAAHQIVEIVTD